MYCGSWDRKTFPYDYTKLANGQQASGMFIWRVQNGRMERSEMVSIEEAASTFIFRKRDADERLNVGMLAPLADKNFRPTAGVPISFCKWIQFVDNSRGVPRQRKALVLAGLDKTVRMYL